MIITDELTSRGLLTGAAALGSLTVLPVSAWGQATQAHISSLNAAAAVPVADGCGGPGPVRQGFD